MVDSFIHVTGLLAIGGYTDLLEGVQFSHLVMSDYLQPHRLQHAKSPCPSPSPGAAQTYIHWVGDAIQPAHPLLSPFPPAFNLSQHQDLFQ